MGCIKVLHKKLTQIINGANINPSINFESSAPSLAHGIGTFSPNPSQTVQVETFSQAVGYLFVKDFGEGGINDGDTFTLNDGVSDFTFEFDNNDDYGATIQVPIVTISSSNVADAMVIAINNQRDNFGMLMSASIVPGFADVILLKNLSEGTAGNVSISESIAESTLNPIGMLGGRSKSANTAVKNGNVLTLTKTHVPGLTPDNKIVVSGTIESMTIDLQRKAGDDVIGSSLLTIILNARANGTYSANDFEFEDPGNLLAGYYFSGGGSSTMSNGTVGSATIAGGQGTNVTVVDVDYTTVNMNGQLNQQGDFVPAGAEIIDAYFVVDNTWHDDVADTSTLEFVLGLNEYTASQLGYLAHQLSQFPAQPYIYSGFTTPFVIATPQQLNPVSSAGDDAPNAFTAGSLKYYLEWNPA